MTVIYRTVRDMSKQSIHPLVIQQTHHIPGHFFCLLCCCVQALLCPWVLINTASKPHSVCLFLAASAPAEAVSPARCLITNNWTAHLSPTLLVSAQSVERRRAQAHTSISPSSSSQTCEHCLLSAVSWPKDLQTFNFLCVLLELSHVKSKPFPAVWHDIMPCPHEDSCIFYKTAPYCILSLNKKG